MAWFGDLTRFPPLFLIALLQDRSGGLALWPLAEGGSPIRLKVEGGLLYDLRLGGVSYPLHFAGLVLLEATRLTAGRFEMQLEPDSRCARSYGVRLDPLLLWLDHNAAQPEGWEGFEEAHWRRSAAHRCGQGCPQAPLEEFWAAAELLLDEPCSVAHLAHSLSVSAAGVRSALHLLAQEGMVEPCAPAPTLCLEPSTADRPSGVVPWVGSASGDVHARAACAHPARAR